MLVYGDPQYTLPRAEARAQLRAFENAGDSLDAARDILIALGQIEQALADADSDPEVLRAAMHGTDRAAEFFVSLVLGKSSHVEILREALEFAARTLAGEGPLQIKIPEGFAFYSLFPEQYITATEIYTAQRKTGPVLIAGIRTIGTGLSAVVKAALIARGFSAQRITVRPHGHPFARETDLGHAPEAAAIIIVDEGPGLSGSSMASVANAFHQRGVTDITFFPSHTRPPGPHATEITHRIWSQTPSIVRPLLDCPDNAILAALRTRTTQLLKSPAESVADLSTGAWLNHVNPSTRIPIAPQFERSKYLVRCANGRTLLWKFAGIGPGQNLARLVDTAFTRQSALARMGWCAPALAACYHFIGTEWISAPIATIRDANSSTLAQVARYIVAAAQPPLTESGAAQALHRLRAMLRCNFTEVDLPDALAHAETLHPEPGILATLPAYGDGRLAPHEWLRIGGQLIKTDPWGHDSDHTLVGPQPILWDIAGAIIEWEVADIPSFLELFARTGMTQRNTLDALRFYLFAYAAFRTGVVSFAGDCKGLSHYREQARRLIAF